MPGLRLFLIALAVLVFAAPAGASDFVPVLEEEEVYFRCTGSWRLSQADLAQSIGWTSQPPTDSVVEGGGCGSHDSQVCCSGSVSNNNYIYDSVFWGDMDGNLDTLTVRAWVNDTGVSRVNSSFTFLVYLAVNGQIRVDNVPITVSPAPTDGLRYVEFTVTDIGLLSEADHNTWHDIELTLKSEIYGGTELTWLYDATEVPSGITFNPAEPAETTIRAR